MFPKSHGKKDVQGPRSIKVPDLGLSEPRISNLFGTLAQVCIGCLQWFTGYTLNAATHRMLLRTQSYLIGVGLLLKGLTYLNIRFELR